MPLLLGDVPSDFQWALVRGVDMWRVIVERDVARALRVTWEFISRYVDNVAPALPTLPPVHTYILQAAGVAACCWMALLVIARISGRIGSRHKEVRLRLSGGRR